MFKDSLIKKIHRLSAVDKYEEYFMTSETDSHDNFDNVESSRVNNLGADFLRKRKDKHSQLIFINEPYEYFEVSSSVTGFRKIRKNICAVLNYSALDLDYSEFLTLFKDINEDTLDQLSGDYLKLKLFN